jgi:hypothetical protein
MGLSNLLSRSIASTTSLGGWMRIGCNGTMGGSQATGQEACPT